MLYCAKTPDELCEYLEPKYKNTKYHHIPLIFSNLMIPNTHNYIIAQGKSRNNIMMLCSMLRKYVDEEVGFIRYEPNYKFLANSTNKSVLRFLTTGFSGGVSRLSAYSKVNNVLLYGVQENKPCWNSIHEIAKKRTDMSNGSLMIYKA